MEHPGATVWFTGIPASGKSDLARELKELLVERGCKVELLDGPEIRQNLSRGLGFSREDREENVRRIGYVAKLLSRNGVITICAAVSPYRATRDEVRRHVTNFVEVWVDCPVELAEERDTEGLYARARLGEISDVTGLDAPYEPPAAAEVVIRPARETIAQGAERVVARMEELGIDPVVESGTLAPAEADAVRRRLAGLGYV